MNIAETLKVPANKLRRTVDTRQLPLIIAPPTENPVLGQNEALEAIQTGLEMSTSDYTQRHYNIAVVGNPNTGRNACVLNYLRRHASNIPSQPPDVVAFINLDDKHRFNVIYVPNGKSETVRTILVDFERWTKTNLVAFVASNRQGLADAVEKVRQQLIDRANEKLKAFGLHMRWGGENLILSFYSLAKPDELMTPDEYNNLDQDIKEELNGREPEAFKAVTIINKTLAFASVQMFKKLVETVDQEVEAELEKIRQETGVDNELFTRYLTTLKKIAAGYAISTAEPDDGNDESSAPSLKTDTESREGMLHHICTIRVLQDNSGVEHPPVVHIQNTAAQYSRLFGRINGEPTGHDTVRLDHTGVDGCSLLEANGGYLVVDLNDLLEHGGGIAFHKLLETISSQKLIIQSKATFLDVGTLTYESNDIPLNVKVVIICDPSWYYVLQAYVPKFGDLFRVVSEFADDMKFEDAPRIYSQFIEICRSESSLPEFSPQAVATLIEFGLRRANHQRRVTTEIGIIKEVITEAAHWARQNGAAVVEAEHVELAIRKRFDRSGLFVRRYQRHIDEGLQLLSHTGERVGQVNGLVVLTLSDEVRFGAPSRITARAFAGNGGVVLVQRETKQSGPSSNAAVQTIAGYLQGEYGRSKPLALGVQLSFEQTYGGIDGDSASLAEIVAITSAITELPVRQNMAITGSVNQLGDAQPIGGVNEKIKGHFDTLERAGVLAPGSGHGVVIPVQNLQHLMLEKEVVAAQEQGLYQVYAVETVDQVLELFLGKPAAKIHDLVAAKLAEMNKKDEDKAKGTDAESKPEAETPPSTSLPPEPTKAV